MASLPFVRQRLGFVMVGVVLLVCLGLLIRQRFFPAVVTPSLAPVEPASSVPFTPVDPVELQAEWRQAVSAILAEYDRTGDARSAKERLLTVRVPASGRDMHLALFIAFNTLTESRPEGKTQLTRARAAFEKATP